MGRRRAPSKTTSPTASPASPSPSAPGPSAWTSEAAQFGASVALSANGNTALVGAFRDSNEGGAEHGAAFVFTRTSGVWTQQGPAVTATGESENGQLGNAVALSANGNTALIGSYFDVPLGAPAKAPPR